MKTFLILLITSILISPAFAQDLYNPDLIVKLHVKSQTIIHSGSSNDTTQLKYDIVGRQIYKKSVQFGSLSVDSTFYKKRLTITKSYTAEGKLKVTETKLYDKSGNIIRYERAQLLPIVNNNGYETTYKKGKRVVSKGFNDGKTTYVYDHTKEISPDSILYDENDTTYRYLLNHSELLWFNEEEDKGDLGCLAFDDKGRIVMSRNYIHNKPQEVSIIIRNYDTENKTYTEEIYTDYYFENGLLKKSVYDDMLVTHSYEFY